MLGNDGEKLQVKARVVSDPAEPGQLQLSPFRSFGFDSAVIVLLSATDYAVSQASKVPRYVVESSALQAHKERQEEERLAAGERWSDHSLVFATRTGSALDAANVRREFKAACKAAGIAGNWTPRELRHSFVSLMSSSGVRVEEIARLAGHSNTRTTEVVYRRELRPVLTTGAEVMDKLFPR